MINILFVCLGNICRSPMAEYVFKNMISKKGLDNKFHVESAATSNEEAGHGIHYGTKRKLEQENIPYGDHHSRKIIKSDYERFDYIIGMEDSNILNINRIIGKDTENKIHKLLEFALDDEYILKDIADPWYTGNFDETYQDITVGCEGLLEHCIKKYNL